MENVVLFLLNVGSKLRSLTPLSLSSGSILAQGLRWDDEDDDSGDGDDVDEVDDGGGDDDYD